MVAAGMMKMATDDDSPSGRVPERGLDWFSVATEPCGSGTSDLGLFLMVCEFWGKEGVREAIEVGTTHLGSPGPLGVPRWVVPPSGHPQVLLWPILGVLVHKKSTKSSVVFGLRLILIYYDVKNMQKNSNWHLALCQ